MLLSLRKSSFGREAVLSDFPSSLRFCKDKQAPGTLQEKKGLGGASRPTPHPACYLPHRFVSLPAGTVPSKLRIEMGDPLSVKKGNDEDDNDDTEGHMCISHDISGFLAKPIWLQPDRKCLREVKAT